MTLDARWHFRNFGSSFGGSEPLALAHTTGVECIEDVYLISPRPDVEVRIRDGALAVRFLRRTNAAGLEYWVTIFRDRFPIDASVAAAILGLWHVRPVDVTSQGFSASGFLALVGRTMPTVASVEVTKKRHRGVLDGCGVEVTETLVDGAPSRTIAVKGPDADRVLAAAQVLGLDRFENVSYVKALQRTLRSARSANIVLHEALSS